MKLGFVDIPDKVIESFAENPKLLLILLGLIIVIIAGSDKIPITNSNINHTWGIILGILGAIIVITNLLLLIRDDLKTSLEEIQKKCKKYNIRITKVSPSKEDTEVNVKVEGKFDIITDKVKLYLFHIDPNNKNGQKQYFPQGEVTIDRDKRTWEGSVRIGGKPERASVMVAIVGTSGIKLCNYYSKVVRETGMFPSILELTEDIIECSTKNALEEFNIE
jgi:hypothetical protein